MLLELRWMESAFLTGRIASPHALDWDGMEWDVEVRLLQSVLGWHGMGSLVAVQEGSFSEMRIR